jgi:hydroxyacylglutathione hydrolase
MPKIIPIPAFTDNYIWLLREGRCAAVVDPGDAAPVIEALDRDGLALTAIVNTHHHGDHVGGNEALLARWPVPVFGPAHERIPGRTRGLVAGDVVAVPGVGLDLTVLDVPGHTAGHIALYGRDGSDGSDGTPVAFVGDTLFAAGCGRVFEGTPEQMAESLARLAALPPATRIYCAHEYTLANLRFALAVEPGNAALQERQRRDQARRDQGLPTVPSTLADELATNPFLRAAVPEVFAAAQAQAGRKLAGPVAAFAVLREWKNHF